MDQSNQVDVRWRKPIQKPIGVYILTIGIFLLPGVFQFLNYVKDFRTSDEGTLIMEISYTTTDLESLALWIGFAKAIGGLVVFLLFFTKGDVVAYYKQGSSPELKI